MSKHQSGSGSPIVKLALTEGQFVGTNVGVIDSLNLTSIFMMFFWDTTKKFLEETGRYFMFPLAAAASIFHAGLSWYESKLANGKKGTYEKAVVEIVSAVAITVAVIGGFFWSSISPLISSVMFAVILTGKSLFNFGVGCYYMALANSARSRANDEEDNTKCQSLLNEANEYSARSRAGFIGFFAGTLATVAVGLVMIALKPLYAVLGVIAGCVGATYAGLGLYHTWQKRKVLQATVQEDEEQLLAASDEDLLVQPGDEPAPLLQVHVAPANSSTGSSAMIAQALQAPPSQISQDSRRTSTSSMVEIDLNASSTAATSTEATTRTNTNPFLQILANGDSNSQSPAGLYDTTPTPTPTPRAGEEASGRKMTL